MPEAHWRTDAPRAEVARGLWKPENHPKRCKCANFIWLAPPRYPLQLRWRPLAAAEAGAAASGAAGMPVRWPRRPAAVSEAAVADAESPT